MVAAALTLGTHVTASYGIVHGNSQANLRCSAGRKDSAQCDNLHKDIVSYRKLDAMCKGEIGISSKIVQFHKCSQCL